MIFDGATMPSATLAANAAGAKWRGGSCRGSTPPAGLGNVCTCPGDAHVDIAPITELIERLYRDESRRVLATLIRLLGDFDLAEEALHEAFRSAVEQWPREGVPDNPRAWLVSAGRFRAIDSLRRQRRFQPLDERIDVPGEDDAQEVELLEDDRLRLIFTCCHPALASDAQVALTLREVCDLSTEEIARAFLSSPSTLAQRIVRAKAKIRDARIPYEVPGRNELPERLEAVLRVIYLVFNEGYFASSGDSLTRSQLSDEAIRLGRLLLELLPEPEVQGLLALMVLHESRRQARSAADGEVILLEAQDRSLWDRELIAEGEALVLQALHSRRFGPYSLQAAIAAVHAEAASLEETDWAQIVGLYDELLRLNPSPVVALNRAVALAMHEGEEVGLMEVERLLASGELDGYHLLHAARADLLRRLGRTDQAIAAYRQALALAQQGADRQFLQKRLEELGSL